MDSSEAEISLLAANVRASGLPPILDVRQAASLLGCSKQHLETLAARGNVPAAKIGRGWIFTSAQLLLHVAALASANLRCPPGLHGSRKESDRLDADPVGTIPLTSAPGETSSWVGDIARPKGRPRRAADSFSDLR